MGARRWAHLPGCRGLSRMPRPPPARLPPSSVSSQMSVASAVCRTRRSWRTRINPRRSRRRARVVLEPPAPPQSRPRRGPSDGVASRPPTGPFGRSSVWPSRTLLGKCVLASWNGSILCYFILVLRNASGIVNLIVSFPCKKFKHYFVDWI